LDIQKIGIEFSPNQVCDGNMGTGRPTHATCPATCRWTEACDNPGATQGGISCGNVCSMLHNCG